MPEIKKWTGSSEPFDRTKLVHSLHAAGADEQVARTVANNITVKEGMSTHELRSQVAQELRKHDPETAEVYESTVRLAAKKAIDAARGTVQMAGETLARLKIKAGETIHIIHKDEKHTFEAQTANVSPSEIRFSEEDIQAIGAEPEFRVATQRPR